MTDLAITILTGGRPRLLKRTIDHFVRHAGGMLESAHVTMLVNGADEMSLGIARATPHVDNLIVSDTKPILTIGAAVSRLMSEVPSSVKYVFHLEDDWECVRPGWYDRARWLLERHPRIGQVRLRMFVSQAVPSQAVSRYNMVTRRIIKWEDRRTSLGWSYREGDGHFTFNPSLVRRDLLASLYPCEGELDAAQKFNSTKLRCAQLVPGYFRHIGGDDSLRERLGRVV